MRCDQLEIRLNELLDSRGSVHLDAAVTTHAAACPRCAEVLRTYRSLADLFDGSTPVDVPEASCERVGSRVVSILQRRRQQRKWRYLSISAAAATILWAAFMTGSTLPATCCRPLASHGMPTRRIPRQSTRTLRFRLLVGTSWPFPMDSDGSPLRRKLTESRSDFGR